MSFTNEQINNLLSIQSKKQTSPEDVINILKIVLPSKKVTIRAIEGEKILTEDENIEIHTPTDDQFGLIFINDMLKVECAKDCCSTRKTNKYKIISIILTLILILSITYIVFIKNKSIS